MSESPIVALFRVYLDTIHRVLPGASTRCAAPCAEHARRWRIRDSPRVRRASRASHLDTRREEKCRDLASTAALFDENLLAFFPARLITSTSTSPLPVTVAR